LLSAAALLGSAEVLGVWPTTVAAMATPAATAAPGRVTKKAAPTTTIAPRPRKLVLIPAYTGAKRDSYCALATDMKARLADLQAKKAQLASRTPASVYADERKVQATLAKASPPQLKPDFEAVGIYVVLFEKLASTKDAKVLAKISTQMSDDAMLNTYLDSTIHIEGFVRRTCGFPVGI
jgi:hypothetical protein